MSGRPKRSEVSGNWHFDEEHQPSGDLVITTGDWAARPDRHPVGDACTAAAHGHQVRPPAEADQTAAHRRDPMADPGRCALARCARLLRAVADRLRLFRRWRRDGTWAPIL